MSLRAYRVPAGRTIQPFAEPATWCSRDRRNSGRAPLGECSVVTAPYEVDGQVVGSVGVIGPTRMAYERVIPIVEITAKLLSSALTFQANC